MRSNEIECPFCNGKPVTYYKFNILTRQHMECSCEEYFNLPDDENLAEHGGYLYTQYDEIPCVFCNGEGVMAIDNPLIEELDEPTADEIRDLRMDFAY